MIEQATGASLRLRSRTTAVVGGLGLLAVVCLYAADGSRTGAYVSSGAATPRAAAPAAVSAPAISEVPFPLALDGQRPSADAEAAVLHDLTAMSPYAGLAYLDKRAKDLQSFGISGEEIEATRQVLEIAWNRDMVGKATGRAGAVTMKLGEARWQQAGLAAALAMALSVPMPAAAGPFTRSEIDSLTYEQIKGTGLANTCPRVEGGSAQDSISISGGKYRMESFCLEPTSFQVLEDKLTKNGVITEAVNTKVTTRQTYTLTGIEGSLASEGGKVVFQEQDGIDYAPSTVQMPGGERVPFLFTVKDLRASSTSGPGSAIDTTSTFKGDFKVPSYRTGLFLDPKGRGMTTGYDQAVALPALQAGGDDKLFNENNKKFDVIKGSIEMKVTNVNQELGEIGGVFVQKQPSDTDQGTKAPKELLLKGSWFATVNKQA